MKNFLWQLENSSWYLDNFCIHRFLGIHLGFLGSSCAHPRSFFSDSVKAFLPAEVSWMNEWARETFIVFPRWVSKSLYSRFTALPYINCVRRLEVRDSRMNCWSIIIAWGCYVKEVSSSSCFELIQHKWPSDLWCASLVLRIWTEVDSLS